MTEISEAAFRKARQLHAAENAWYIRGVGFENSYSSTEVALARVLQEHSNVAKLARDLIASDHGAHHAEFLQSLILPDEPCKHQISYMLSGPLVGVNASSAMACSKCGKALKIVEAGDE